MEPALFKAIRGNSHPVFEEISKDDILTPFEESDIVIANTKY